jgi:hypothetical protein
MKKLRKADNEYNKIPALTLWGIILALVIANSIWGGMEEVAVLVMVASAVLIGRGMIASESLKTKRIRMLSALPLSARQLGMYRQSGILIGWPLWISLIAISSLISQRGNLGLDYVWWMLTRIGCMFIFTGFMDLASCLFYCVKEKKPDKTVMKWVIYPFLMIVSTAGIFLLYIITTPSGNYHSRFLNSIIDLASTPYGSLAILFVGLISMALSVYAYERRRSYLEESIFPS